MLPTCVGRLSAYAVSRIPIMGRAFRRDTLRGVIMRFAEGKNAYDVLATLKACVLHYGIELDNL
jgi:hypothetical protein